MKKRKPKPDHRNAFSFTIGYANYADLKPKSRSYRVGDTDVVATLTLYADQDILDERERSYTVRGAPFLPWRDRIRENGNRAERREAAEATGTARAFTLAGFERVDMTPLAVLPTMPDIHVAFQGGGEVFVEVTQAREAADSQRQAAIREIAARVERRVVDEGLETDGNLSFAFRDCPSEREMQPTVDAIVDCIADRASWPEPTKWITPSSPHLAPYCRIGRNAADEPLTFSSDMGRVAIVDPVAIVREALKRKRSANYKPTPLWLVVNALLPMGGATTAIFESDEPLGQFERILVYDGFRILSLAKAAKGEAVSNDQPAPDVDHNTQ